MHSRLEASIQQATLKYQGIQLRNKKFIAVPQFLDKAQLNMSKRL